MSPAWSDTERGDKNGKGSTAVQQKTRESHPIRLHLPLEALPERWFPLFIKRCLQCLAEQFAQPGLQAVAQFFIAQPEVDVGRQIIHPIPGVETDASHLHSQHAPFPG